MHRGFGTERIEDDIKLIFPEAKVARMDLDTTRTQMCIRDRTSAGYLSFQVSGR